MYPIEYEPGQPAPPAKAPAPAPTTTTARPAPPPPAARPAPAEPLVSAGGIFHSFQGSKHKLWDINKVGVHVIRCNKGQKQLRPVNQLHAQRYTHFFFFPLFSMIRPSSLPFRCHCDLLVGVDKNRLTDLLTVVSLVHFCIVFVLQRARLKAVLMVMGINGILILARVAVAYLAA